jgi:predicted phosphate transport protein (TIGR00153 family)
VEETMFFGKSKEKDVFALFITHSELLGKALESLNETVKCYLDSKCEFTNHSKMIHKYEHEADSIEKEIRNLLYKGAFYQGLRSDFAELVIDIEDIFESAVIVGRKLSEENPDLSVFTEEMKELFLEMCTNTVKIAYPLKEAISFLTQDVSRVPEFCEQIKKFESNVDICLHKLIKRIFALDIELARKLQLRDILLYMSYITDKAEDLTDRIEILSMNMNI